MVMRGVMLLGRRCCQICTTCTSASWHGRQQELLETLGRLQPLLLPQCRQQQQGWCQDLVLHLLLPLLLLVVVLREHEPV